MVRLDGQTSELIDQSVYWNLNSLITSIQKESLQSFGLSMWYKINQSQQSEIQIPLIGISGNQQETLFEVQIMNENNKTFLQSYTSEGESTINFECEYDKWKLIVITFQSEISVWILDPHENKNTIIQIRYRDYIKFQTQDISIFTYFKPQILVQQDIYLFYSSIFNSLNTVLKQMINIQIQKKKNELIIDKKNQNQIELQTSVISQKRNLQSIQYIQGEQMTSLIRNINQDIEYKQTIFSVQSLSSFMVIGYFKLTQEIIASQYLPIITLGVQSQFYNFLNLYIMNKTKIELKYIHDTDNIILKKSQTLNNFQFSWIALGIVYSIATQQAKIVYSDTNSKLYSSPIISSASFPPTILTLDACISCNIDGGVFDHFNGYVSSVKFIADITFGSTDNYYFFNEVFITQKQIILDVSFNTNNYIPNSEYDFGKGFACQSNQQSNYVFFEGVCVNVQNCQNLNALFIDPKSDIYESFENGKFFDNSSQKCISCSSNCLQCNSRSACTECRPSYKIIGGICVRCDSQNSCNAQCQSYQFYDPLNQICVLYFNTDSQKLSQPLLSSRFIDDNTDITVESSPPFNSIYDQIVYCYIDADQNPMTLHSFIGGSKFTTQTVLKKTWTEIPKGYQKSVSFYVLFYGNGTPSSNLQVKINSNIATIDNKIETSRIACSGSGSQQTIYKVTYKILDYLSTFELEIKSSQNKWGIRNLNIEISKCHPSCDSCKQGGTIDDCTTCDSSLIKNKFQCICPFGKYAKYLNCFDSPCVTCEACSRQNCQKCQDITGTCTQCDIGYSLKNYSCVDNNSCNLLDTVQTIQSQNFCGVFKQKSFTHFKDDRVVQYADYWKFQSDDVFVYECTPNKCPPLLTLKNRHTLTMTLPNYKAYHYQLSIMINFFEFHSIDPEDFVNIYDGNTQLYSHCYFIELSKMDPRPDILFFPQEITYLKNNNKLSFIFESATDESLLNEGQTFTQLIFSYVRCHPLCKSCNGSTESFCIDCIDNAIKNSGNCECKSGYYFSLIRFPQGDIQPGSCLKCNSACKTCSGPSIQDCIICQDWYDLVDNICTYQCKEGFYLNQISQSCEACHPCCRTCEGGENNNCFDCKLGYTFNISNKSCMVYNLQCQACTVAVNFLCGGTQSSHNNCISNGWVAFEKNICVNCSQLFKGKCGGYYPQNIIDFCFQAGFFNYDSNNCSSCSEKISNNCGRDEIATQCVNNGWVQYNSKICKNCSSNSLTFNECICYDSCLTCSQYFDPKKCDLCKPSYYFFKYQCLPKCPNGYIISEKKCIMCTDQQLKTCVNCYQTCLICEPFLITNLKNSCTQCSSTRKLVQGECQCIEPEDTRDTFYECSYKNIAVLTSLLSNSDPILKIDFGKQIQIPNNFQSDIYTIALCQYLFKTQTIELIGQLSKCSISGSYISIDLVYFNIQNIEDNSKIFHEDIIQFQPNILSFRSSNQILIDNYMNKMVEQSKIIGQTRVLFEYETISNSCIDIKIKFKKIINGANRGFKSYNWSLKSILSMSTNNQNILESILQNANKEYQTDLLIPQGIIQPNDKVTIKFNYELKANVISYEEIILSVKLEKNIFLGVDSTILNPFFKYQSGLVVISSYIKICSPAGDIQIYEPLQLSITSQEYPKINYQDSNYIKQDYSIALEAYSLPTQKIIINIAAKLVSDSFIQSQIDFQIDVQASQLYVKIIGGNSYFNYKKQVVINSQVRDFDIQSENDDQGIDTQWSCIDLSTEKSCLNINGIQVNFPSQKLTATIESFTFKPYTAIRIILKGEKNPNRQSTDQISVLFSELDLPTLGVQIQTNDPKQETVNLNEEIFIKLDYNSQVNIDILSFSGTIQYENNVVGIIKFDYTSLRFQIWNYFSEFKRDNSQFQIRFNVFNPQYYMPSMFLITLNLNFPPNKCKFIVNPIADGYSLETMYFMQIYNCVDENQPIQYQFFYFKNSDDFEYEKNNPLQIKRRQINDKSQNHIVQTSLPPGNILILVQAIDSKSAVFNTTISINVKLKQYDEQSYLQIIQQKLDQINKMKTNNVINDLSIICDDILQRTQFKQSSSLNSKKIEILNKLISLQKDLSPLSYFSTLIDKSITALTQSGIIYSQTQSSDLLQQLIQSLDESSNLNKLNLEISKEKLKQKLYDNFQVIDNLQNSLPNAQSSDKIIELTDKIGWYLFKNILPNEDPIYYEGNQMSVLGTQITEKYICAYFLCSNISPTDSSKQTSIYNFKKSQYQENPYSQDDSFQKYTDSLKQIISETQISNYPIITPSIQNEKNIILESFSKQAIITFPILQAQTDSKSMTCLSKNKDTEWTTSNCQIIYQYEQNQYSCVCSKLSPTTVINDLEELLNNKNIQTAFSSDGYMNISNFKEFYKYVVFWLLSLQTVLLVAFYLKGFNLDALDSKQKLNRINEFMKSKQNEQQKSNMNHNKVFPIIMAKNTLDHNQNFGEQKVETLQTQNIDLNQSPILQQTESPNQNFASQHTTPQINAIPSLIALDEEFANQQHSKRQYRQTTQTISSMPHQFEFNDFKNQQNESLNKIDLNQKNSFILKNIPQNDQGHKKQKILSTNIITRIDEQKEFDFIAKEQNLREDNMNNTICNNNTDRQKLTWRRRRSKKNTLIEFSKDFNDISKFKQVLFFHNFFGIFFIYNPDLSRAMRFIMFYARSVHSLGITVIFDESYSIVQKIAVSFINATTIIIVLNIFEIILSIKNIIGKIVSRIIIGLILLGYLYVILSIVSGQTPQQSNTCVLTFIMIYSLDMFVISFFSAICQQQIAKYIIKRQQIKGIIKVLYKLIQLQLILIQIK